MIDMGFNVSEIDTDQWPTVRQPIDEYLTAIADTEAVRDDFTRTAFLRAV
jgi:hypothetical protein